MTQEKFIPTLIKELSSSTNADRDAWARKIVDDQFPIEELLSLLSEEHKTASRALWLFSQIAMVDPSYLHPHLWSIYECFVENKINGGEVSIANQWLICGIPKEQEGKAIDVLFEWLGSANTNDTTKLRARKTLVKVAEKYPDILNELESREGIRVT